ncbi:MAG: LCP family protein [Acidimicrobiales bacterium]
MTRPSRSWFERGVIALGVVGITTSLMGAGVMAWGLDKYEAIGSVEIGSVEAAEVGEPSNWLLVGTDSREGIDPNDPGAGVFLGEGAPEGKRTDTMIVARVDPTTGRIDLLSIPRDLYVPLDGGGEGRVNSAFNGEGGEERLVNTIESYFGIEINHYAEVNFVGFQDIVEGLGGVPIWFDYPMRDAGSGLNVPNAGCQVLDGFQSLAFVRGRHVEYFQDGSWHSDGTGDLGRSSRQQYFIRRVADTTLQKINIAEIGTLNNVLNIAGANLTIDGGAEIGSRSHWRRPLVASPATRSSGTRCRSTTSAPRRERPCLVSSASWPNRRSPSSGAKSRPRSPRRRCRSSTASRTVRGFPDRRPKRRRRSAPSV